MNQQNQVIAFALRFLNSIDCELQARTGNQNLTHLDFPDFNFSSDFELGATVAETVTELLFSLES